MRQLLAEVDSQELAEWMALDQLVAKERTSATLSAQAEAGLTARKARRRR